ncbi:ATP-binding protein [Desulfoluna butyratoxydans]|uniref:ATP-binding protein n=1 Tax=Desulfoluna butyratoxydans TaxID=231438 RepID=UPI0015D26F74|nr:ATP-binding protein [Desulfoluna butyratoxydans]
MCKKKNASSGALYNSRLLKFCDNYAREKYALLSLEPVYQAAGIRKYEIDDPGHWFTQDQCDKYYFSLMDMCGSPEFAREAGRYIIRSKEMWVVRQFILGMVSPSAFFSTIERNYCKVSRGVHATAHLTGKESAEMTCRPAPGTAIKPYQCDVCVGILEAVGLLFTNAFAHVKHTECIHKGGEACRFEVTWSAAPSVVWRRMRNRAFVVGAPLGIGMAVLFPSPLVLLLSCSLFLAIAGLGGVAHHKREEELLNIIQAQGNYAGDLAEDDNIRNRHSLLIKSISQEAAMTDSQEVGAQGVINVMARHLDYDRIAFFFYDGKRLKLASQVGYTPAQVDHFKEQGGIICRTESMTRVLWNKENIVVNGVKGFSETTLFGPDFPDVQSLESLLVVPVAMEGRISGVLVAANLHGKRALTQGDLSLLIGVATQVGLSIDNVGKRRELAERERRYRKQVQKGLEDERRRIAFDLHDHVAQDLGSLMITARMMQEMASRKEAVPPGDLQAFVSVLKGSIDSVRNIAYDLQPPSLAQFGLVHTIKVYAADYSDKYGVEVDFRVAGVREALLEYDTKINFFRIIQESLTNIYKHAYADKVFIRLVFSHPNLILRIRDNGSGFMPQALEGGASCGRHMGLRNMEERARLMKGTFRIYSSPEKGCEIVVEVPLEREEEKEGGSGLAAGSAARPPEGSRAD